MVQIGRRGTAWRLFENFKEFSKITEFEFQNSGPSFFVSVSPAYCKKKFDSIWTKLTEEIDFEVCRDGDFGNGTAAAAWCSAGYSDWTGGAAACSDQSSGALRTGGIRNWECNWAVKSNRFVFMFFTLNGRYVTLMARFGRRVHCTVHSFVPYFVFTDTGTGPQRL